MPNWIRTLFLKYLPIFLFMRRPKKTRLRWMMEIPGTSRKVPPGPPPNVMTSSGGMLPGGIPDGGIHGISQRSLLVPLNSFKNLMFLTFLGHK